MRRATLTLTRSAPRLTTARMSTTILSRAVSLKSRKRSRSAQTPRSTSSCIGTSRSPLLAAAAAPRASCTSLPKTPTALVSTSSTATTTRLTAIRCKCSPSPTRLPTMSSLTCRLPWSPPPFSCRRPCSSTLSSATANSSSKPRTDRRQAHSWATPTPTARAHSAPAPTNRFPTRTAARLRSARRRPSSTRSVRQVARRSSSTLTANAFNRLSTAASQISFALTAWTLLSLEMTKITTASVTSLAHRPPHRKQPPSPR
mmetsp:Transcript_13957/g.24028  ORF Transcript_13957/g.24028 Transcript_13957/m.24028 type:complete len:258 (-) Transcript_13957:360-1133(-)